MVLHYNPSLVYKMPDKYFHKYFDAYLRPDYLTYLDKVKRNDKLYSAHITSDFSTFFDRTGNIKDPFVRKIYSQVPEYDPYYSKSFVDVCDIRTKELLNRNKKINVMWSGGIDSTCILFSMLEHRQHKDQITVKMNYNSIIESGYVFDRFVKNNFNCTIDTVKMVSEKYNPEELYVTGECGGQMYASAKTVLPHLTGKKVEELHKDAPFEEYLNTKVYEYFKPALDAFPKKIITIEDFRWFIGFVFRWQQNSLCMMFLTNEHGLGKKYPESIIAYYDTPDFQQWTMAGHERDNDDWKYKKPHKKVIYKVAGPDIKDYNDRKTTVPSVYVNYNKNYLLTTGDFENIYVTDEDLKEIYGRG